MRVLEVRMLSIREDEISTVFHRGFICELLSLRPVMTTEFVGSQCVSSGNLEQHLCLARPQMMVIHSHSLRAQ